MKTTILLPLLALGLAACQTYPQMPGDPGGQQGRVEYPPYLPGPIHPVPDYPQPGDPTGATIYRAFGSNPFWNLEIGRDLVFVGRGKYRFVEPAPPPIISDFSPVHGTPRLIYRTPQLEVEIRPNRCSDGRSVSDRIVYPAEIHVMFGGLRYSGCGAPIAVFSQVGETGQPNYPAPGTPGAVNLTGTNWRVMAINGRPTQPSNYYINFMPDGINAKFGCNLFFVGYIQSSNILITGEGEMVWKRRITCPDMSFENQGSAVLEQPMTISGVGNHLTLSNRSGSIDLARAN